MRVTVPPSAGPISYETVFVEKPENAQIINSLTLENQELKIQLQNASVKYVEKIIEKPVYKDLEIIEKYNKVVRDLAVLRAQPKDVEYKERIVEKIVEMPIHIEKLISIPDMDLVKKWACIVGIAAWIIGAIFGAIVL